MNKRLGIVAVAAVVVPMAVPTTALAADSGMGSPGGTSSTNVVPTLADEQRLAIKAGEYFGKSLAIADTTAVVGAVELLGLVKDQLTSPGDPKNFAFTRWP